MFYVNNAPVSYPQLVHFAQMVALEVDRRQLDPEDVELVVAVRTGGTAQLVVGRTHDRAATTARIDQLLAPRRRMAATVSTIGWAPDLTTPTTVAWILIAVGVGGVPAVAAVRRIEEDDQWRQLSVKGLPWLALSTAGGLRAALEHGAPLRLKFAVDRRLFQTPDERPTPPLDDSGEL